VQPAEHHFADGAGWMSHSPLSQAEKPMASVEA